jgi:uncharacterized protein YcfJ
METIRTAATRIHPVMAIAAVSVILVSLTGVAAITGMLPTSHGAPDAQVSSVAPAAQPYVATAAAPMPAQAGAQLAGTAPMAANLQAAAAPQPQVIKEVVIKEVVKEKPVHHYHTQRVAQNDAPTYSQQPAPAPAPAPAAQPNYVGIGAGAVIGGLIGNQVGGGNGRKLATVAGVIGGGLVGNEIANRNK